jgi:S1-C subfamily serine protease
LFCGRLVVVKKGREKSRPYVLCKHSYSFIIISQTSPIIGGKEVVMSRFKGSIIAKLALTVAVAATLVSCASIAKDINPKVEMDFPKADNIKFTVVHGKDPMKIGKVVSEGIGKRGYSVSVKTDEKEVSGILGTFQQAMVAATINAAWRGPREGQGSSQKKSASTGTGFFVNNDGTIVTCAHVVAGANKLAVNINGTRYDARVISANESTDLAIIKIDYASDNYFSLSELEREDVGNKVSVLGYPLSHVLGTEVRFTDGLISAKTGINSNPTYFQMSVPVQPGNSGGPIFNERFQVVGVASSRLSDMATLQQTGTVPQNVNFGVKSEYVKLLGSQHFGSGNVLSSISDAMSATVQVIANPDLLDGDSQASEASVSMSEVGGPVSDIEVRITYMYNKDAYHYTSTYMDIEFVDKSTGVIVGNGIFIGSSYGSAKKVAQVVLQQMLDKMK